MGSFSPNKKVTFAFVILGFALLIIQYQNCSPSGGNAFVFGSGGFGSGGSYSQTVLADGPEYFWQLAEQSGTSFADSTGNVNTGILSGAVEYGLAPYNTSTMSTAIGLNGGSAAIGTSLQVTSPSTFSIELWIRGNTPGGHIFGFGTSQSGNSAGVDRMIYMSNTGVVYFGIYQAQPQVPETLQSTAPLNDGNWHYIVATFSPSGGFLYVDGNEQSGAPAFSPEVYSGYWRIGYDSMVSTWPGYPSNLNYFGAINNVAIYNVALTPQQILAHYQAAQGSN